MSEHVPLTRPDPFSDNATLIATALAYYAAHLREMAWMDERYATDILRGAQGRHTASEDRALTRADHHRAHALQVDSVIADLDAIDDLHQARHHARRRAWLRGEETP